MNLLLLTIHTWDNLAESESKKHRTHKTKKTMTAIVALFTLFFTYQILIDILNYHLR